MFLTGPGGAGKSTFLRLLLREELPSEGDLKVLGRDLKTLRPSQVQTFRRSGSCSRTYHGVSGFDPRGTQMSGQHLSTMPAVFTLDFFAAGPAFHGDGTKPMRRIRPENRGSVRTLSNIGSTARDTSSASR